MGKLKPIGSEKLQGQEKISRILEIARYNEIIPNPVNETFADTYEIELADGNLYKIFKEKNGYVIKKTIKEGTEDYLEPMKNRKYYSSYSQAFKRLNLIAKEVNSIVGNETEISLFGEQKKFTLKTPKSAPELPPSPEPSPEIPVDDTTSVDTPIDMGTEDMPAAGTGGEEMSTPDMGSEDMSTTDMGVDTGEEVTMKMIQKLTGKLGQKIRQFSEDQELSSNDAKYVINSILSAIDLTKLEPEDKEEILGRLEGEEEGIEDMGNDDEMLEPDTDMEEMPEPPESPEMSEEMPNLGRIIDNKIKGAYTSTLGDKMEEYESKGISKILNNVFSESKVEKIISKYFEIDEKEQQLIESKNKNKTNSTFEKVKSLCETFDQENTSKKLIQKYPDVMFVGKTNKNNLLFQINENKIKVTPQGKVL